MMASTPERAASRPRPGRAGAPAAALLALACSATPGQAREAPRAAVEVDAKIVLAVDASRSIDSTELTVERDGYVQALYEPALIRAIAAGRLGRVAFAYFEWSGQASDGGLVPWRVVGGADDAEGFAAEIAALPTSRRMGTSISRALAFATLLLEQDGVTSERRIVDVSGDGVNNIGPSVTAARDGAVAHGITINGLPVLVAGEHSGRPDLERYFEECVIGGPGAFVLSAHSREEMADTVLRKLLIEISDREPAARPVLAEYEPVDCLIGERLARKRMSNPP